MNYICAISNPSEIWGKQYETEQKDALLCVNYCEKPENGVTLSIVHPVTGKTLDSVTYDGTAWKKPEKTKKPRKSRKTAAQKSDTDAQQISLF